MTKLKLPQAKYGKLILRHKSKIVAEDQRAMSQDNNKDNNDIKTITTKTKQQQHQWQHQQQQQQKQQQWQQQFMSDD